MTPDDQISLSRQAAIRIRLGVLKRKIVQRVLAPDARRHAALVGAVGKLEAELEHVSERHTEQIERLEDLVRELVLAVEALRRASAREDPGEQR